MVRVALLLLIASGLVIFTIQNLSPIALVVLGTRTLALPLAVWVVGSLAAGALTTLVLTGFSNLSKAGAVRRAGQRSTGESTAPYSPWGGVGTKRGAAEATGTRPKNTVGFTSASDRRASEGRASESRINDDWEASDIDREAWDDWGEPASPQRRTTSFNSSNVRAPADENWIRENNPASADDPLTRRREPRPDANPTDAVPRANRQRNLPDDAPSRNEVYDAEYRVIIPPHTPTPAAYSPPPVPQPAPSPTPDPLDDDDDWGLDDLDLKK